MNEKNYQELKRLRKEIIELREENREWRDIINKLKKQGLIE
jgi:hypothetical protein